MKRVAAIILNRNLPQVADELGQWILDNHGDHVDLFVVENGSDSDHYSRFANIIFQESGGPARGVNEALNILLNQPYEYFWVNFNDARYEKPEFLSEAVEIMDKHLEVGIFTGFWPGTMRVAGDKYGKLMIVFFDPLGFVVSRKALEACRAFSSLSLTPLWDSSNFSNHYNILGTALALYKSGMCMLVDPRYTIHELTEPAAENSKQARGFDDTTWKEIIGPRSLTDWLSRTWPHYAGDMKAVRERVIQDIERAARVHFPQPTKPASRAGLQQLVDRVTGK